MRCPIIKSSHSSNHPLSQYPLHDHTIICHPIILSYYYPTIMSSCPLSTINYPSYSHIIIPLHHAIISCPHIIIYHSIMHYPMLHAIMPSNHHIIIHHPSYHHLPCHDIIIIHHHYPVIPSCYYPLPTVPASCHPLIMIHSIVSNPLHVFLSYILVACC